MTKCSNPVLVGLFIFLVSSNSFAEKKSWRFLAGMEDNFVHESNLSLMVGELGPSNKKIGVANVIYGLEVSFNSPIIQPPTNKIRQQISILQYEDGNSTVQSVQINPHYVVEVSPKLWVGAGPGVGYVRTKVRGIKSNLYAGQIGASIHYTFHKLFLGGEARYQITQDGVGGKIAANANSWQTFVKLGFNFR